MPLLTVDDGQLYYEVLGSGPPLLLLPGLGRGTSYYDPVTPLLTDQFQVIRVDPRGVGRSSRGPLPYTYERWSQDYAALLDHLRIEATAVVGCSQGSAMAMHLADCHPERVSVLVLIGALASVDRFIELNVRLRITLARKLGLGEEMRDFVALWTFGHELLDRPEADRLLQAGLDAIKEHTPDNYIALCESLLDWGHRKPSFLERLPHIEQPTLVACGCNDYWIPPKFSREVARAIPGAQYVEMKDCGHVPVREQPKASAEMITSFWAQAQGRRTSPRTASARG
jgi:pimeloyl-ACP methyl ester carboxylesterase